jgi:hypothetical protein
MDLPASPSPDDAESFFSDNLFYLLKSDALNKADLIPRVQANPIVAVPRLQKILLRLYAEDGDTDWLTFHHQLQSFAESYLSPPPQQL